MKPTGTMRSGLPMPPEAGFIGPPEEACGLVMGADEYDGAFRSGGVGMTFTLDVLISRRDAHAFKEAVSDEERQAIIDEYVQSLDATFDHKTYRIPKGALLGSTLVYEVEEITRTSTLDL